MPLILAIETSSLVGAVALCGDGVALAESVLDRDVKLSAWVLPAIERLLARYDHHGHHGDIAAIGWGAGPGAFTGVRTACATAQALAYAWQKPLVTVDSLAALAEASEAPAVSVVLDARMDEVYAAAFRRNAAGALERTAATRLAAPSTIAIGPGEVTIGSGAHLVPSATTDDALTAHAEAHWAQGVARVAERKLLRGETTDPLHAAPIYVRNKVALTEAERATARTAQAAAARA